MHAETKARISGALYDFMAYLATREGSYSYGAGYECATDLLNHFQEWAEIRGLVPFDTEPNVQGWELGESMIDIFLEFYGQGRLSVRAPGYSQVGTAGSDRGRVDTTNYAKRRRWLDAKPKPSVGSVSRTHPDDPPAHQREGLSTNYGPGSERYPKVDGSEVGQNGWEKRKRKLVRKKDGKPELEYFGLAGMPGGQRYDNEDPPSYSTIPQK